MNLLNVTPEAYNQYCSTVNANKNTSFDLAQKKLTRNVQIVKEATPKRIIEGYQETTYLYGKLRITVVNDTVVKVENAKSRLGKWVVPNQLYMMLNEYLGIDDCKFSKQQVNS